MISNPPESLTPLNSPRRALSFRFALTSPRRRARLGEPSPSDRAGRSRPKSSLQQHITKPRSFVGLLALGFVLLGADKALATVTATPATGGTSISADTTGG